MGAPLAAALAVVFPVLVVGTAEGQSRSGDGEIAVPAKIPAVPSGQSPQGPQAPSGQAPAVPPASPDVEPRPGRVKLVYTLGPGTRGCDDEAFFRRMVASELEVSDPFVPAGPATHELEVVIQKDTPGFRATVKLRDAAGKEVYFRDFLERTCADAVDRAVIVSMLTVFPPVQQPTGPPAPPPSAGPRAEDASALERRVAELEARAKAQDGKIESLAARLEALENVRTGTKEKEKRTKMDIAFALSAGALLTAALTPDVAPGVWLGGEGSWGPLSVGVEARVVLPSRVHLGADQFDFSEMVGLFVPCGRYKYFFGCGVVGGGTQLSYGDPAIYTDPSLFVAILQLGGRLGAEIPFGDSIVAARAWGEVLYTTPPSATFIVDTGLLWDRPMVSAFFGLGLVFKLN